MKLPSFMCCLLVLLLTEYGNAASKSSSTTKAITTSTKLTATDKISYPKKVSSVKKRPSKTTLKKVADITDKFKDLPADDLAFIKELDKQFKEHGGKVKIKVENDNRTTSTKNSKRTIEGDLGYGYSHNGYDYNPPKYMFYPYSQQDISHNSPKYYLPDGKTEVSIEPSYSYELKPQTYLEHSEPQVDLPHSEAETPHQEQSDNGAHHHHQQQHQQQQQYEEPVIVLRIPGPAKYASHLQQLLQQYLEIRASQYLRILEEAEHRNHAPQHQLQQIDYGQAPAEQDDQQQHHHQHHYQQQAQVDQHDYQQHQQQVQYEQQPEQYPEIDHVYQHYKQRHPSHPEQAQQPEQPEQTYYVSAQAEEPQHQHYAPAQQHSQHPQQEQPQFYYTHTQQYAQPEGPPANTFQQIYLVSMSAQDHTGYESDQAQPEHQTVYVQEQQGDGHDEHSSLPISENNPRASHTKVIFTQDSEHGGADYSQMYPLPSIKPNDRHAPSSVPDYHQDYQQQPHPQILQQESQESAQHYQQQLVAPAAAPEAHQQVVAITQRPFNYHAHGVKPRARGRGSHKRRAGATAIHKADEDLQKIREYVRDKLGAQTGTAVEYKTTQVIEG